jgi:tol-pal system protein YbgF
LATGIKPASTGAGLDETQQYPQALSYLTQKQYPKAITAFTAYARDFPRGQFAANTQYWLGELYYQQSNWLSARRAFEQVAKVDARSNKVPDAALKLALIQMKTGQVAVGKKALGALKQAYPNSTAAQLATIELQRAA